MAAEVCQRKCTETSAWRGNDLLANGEDSLDCYIHDHQAFSSELEWKNLQRVRDQQSRPGKGVEDTEEPYEWDLSIASTLVSRVAVFIDGTGDGPADEHYNHAGRRCQEKRTSSNAIDELGGSHGDDKGEQCVSSIELIATVSSYTTEKQKVDQGERTAIFCD